jgi:hypothetical protein
MSEPLKRIKNTYFESLKTVVLDWSDTKIWETARFEWRIESIIIVMGKRNGDEPAYVSFSPKTFTFEECHNSTIRTTCHCTKQHLKFLFTIVNTINGNELFPIGSECIRRFGNDELIDQMLFLKSIFDNMQNLGNKTFHYSRQYENTKVKEIVKDTSYMEFLIQRRKPSTDKQKNHAYDELILFYKFVNNEKIEFQDYAKEELERLLLYKEEKRKKRKAEKNARTDTVGHSKAQLKITVPVPFVL